MRIIMRSAALGGVPDVRDPGVCAGSTVKNDCIELPDAKTGGRVVVVPGMSIVRKELVPSMKPNASQPTRLSRCCIQS